LSPNTEVKKKTKFGMGKTVGGGGLEPKMANREETAVTIGGLRGGFFKGGGLKIICSAACKWF
jgi:hypothetical protein